MGAFNRSIGVKLAEYLSRPLPGYEVFSTSSEELLQATLKIGDILLVEGNSRISSTIKFLTQSTWSHAAIYIGHGDGLEHPLLEADLIEGVIRVPLSKYTELNTRICRPVDLTEEDAQKVVTYLESTLNMQYDLKNIFDLVRYLIPSPPIPARFRRRMIEFGSGDPTKAICSTIIAQAYQSVQYPILPRPASDVSGATTTDLEEDYLRVKHYTHFTPRDFDLSPYFKIVKPTLAHSFNYKALKWAKKYDAD